MYQEDYFNPLNPNDYNGDDEFGKTFNVVKEDKGVNHITRKVKMYNGNIKNKRIRVYTSSGVGTYIRDAETGDLYSYKVGSKSEDIFYKVIIATGECNSKNGSSTLFYCSPQHYENHLFTTVEPKRIAEWEEKRDKRIAEWEEKRDKRLKD